MRTGRQVISGNCHDRLMADLARGDRAVERVGRQVTAQERRVAKLQTRDKKSDFDERALRALRDTLAALERHRDFLRSKVMVTSMELSGAFSSI